MWKPHVTLIDVKPTGLQILWCTGHKCKPWLSRHGGNSIFGSSVDQKVQITCLERIHCIFGLALIFYFIFLDSVLNHSPKLCTNIKVNSAVQFMELFCAFAYITLSTFQLESTDVGRGCLRIGAASEVFFFFFLGFAPTRLDSRQIGFDLSRTRLIRPESGHIGHIGSYRLATDTAETGLKRPKQAEISLETRRNSWNYDLKGVSCLLLSLFCESRHSNVFFKNILIVKIYRKYK